MPMPGRNSHAMASGINSSGTTTVSGITYATDLTVTSRSGSTPAAYKAVNSIEFVGEYVDNGAEEYEAFIVNQTNPDPNPTTGTVNSNNVDGYRYGFNGKENDKDISEGDLDYGARIYDSRLGRWLALDPLQAKYPSLSPYNYVFNCPLIHTDPDGKEPIVTIKKLSSKVENGKTIITVVIDITIKGKVINNSSSASLGYPSAIADQVNNKGNSFFNGSGVISSSEMYKFDGKGSQNKKPTSTEIRYTVNTTFDMRAAKDENGVNKNDDVVIIQDKVQCGKIDAAGCNDGTGVAEARVNSGFANTFTVAMTVLHELLHSYGLDDEYTTKSDGTVANCATGNVMGCVQDISNVKVTQAQQDKFVLDVLKTNESVKQHKTDYSGIKGKDIKKETKKKLGKS